MKPLKGEPFDRYRIPREEFLACLPADKRETWLKINRDVRDDPYNGMFTFTYHGMRLLVIASNGGGWDHLSISTQGRCPTWEEMEVIAKLFFRPNEAAYQLHVPAKDYVNEHPHTLHWWRPHHQKIPRPPKQYV
jgi:hypothetical protein